ncbi:MAG: Uma2 family endonuclease [Armatimonadetes bacterium]|nr:Uma2 family endonuclease [Anaerolineae bacterium]
MAQLEIQHHAKQMTVEAFWDWCDLPENADRLFELYDGEIIEKTPSFEPSEIAITIGAFIKFYLLQNPIGRLSGADGTYKMSDTRSYIPDVAYISKARMPDTPKRGVLVPPDLAVEVMSPTDSKRQLRLKAERYIELGTQLVWLVFPDTQQVEVYHDANDVLTVGIAGLLEGYAVLPGFTLAVSAIFVTI